MVELELGLLDVITWDGNMDGKIDGHIPGAFVVVPFQRYPTLITLCPRPVDCDLVVLLQDSGRCSASCLRVYLMPESSAVSVKVS